MRTKSFLKALVAVVGCVLLTTASGALAAQRMKPVPSLNEPADQNLNRINALSEEVRHRLVVLPYYSVFDWLQAEVKGDGSITLTGEVTRPSLKDDAVTNVRRIEGAGTVTDKIEILPLSSMDDQLRIALYRSIYSFNSPLFRYATQSLPPIHIIVKNGDVTLKGIVANQSDSDMANLSANQVPGVFSVRNELQIEGRTDERISQR